MAQAHYPYLDLTVMPQLRGHVLAPHATVLFDAELKNVLWANGEGAKLVGTPAVADALEQRFTPNSAMMRQIGNAVDMIEDGGTSAAMMRVKTGFKTRLVAFQVSPLVLPQGEDAILMVTDSMHGRGHTETDMAQTAVSALDGNTHASAILDHLGNAVAQSAHFKELEVTKGELMKLISDVAKQEDSLVKRPVQTAEGEMPAGIARLTDNSAYHIVIIADAEIELGLDEGKTLSPAVPLSSSANADAAQAEVDETEADTDDADDNAEEAAPMVGAFSNKRSGGRSGLGRWYYKPKSSDDSSDASSGESDEIDDEAENDGQSAASALTDGQGELRQTIHEADQAAETTTSDADNDAEAVAVQDDNQTALQSDDNNDQTAASESDQVNLVGSGLVQEVDHTDIDEQANVDQVLGDETLQAEAEDEIEAEAEAALHAAEDEMREDGFRFVAGSKPVRFVWEMDEHQEFRSVSEEFAEAVGPKAANIEGLKWQEVAEMMGLENADEVSRLLALEDTWSGKTVLWPVEGTDLRVPIDLAGLPSYGRNRVFDGFNGFGIVRTADALVDPEARGVSLLNDEDTDPSSFGAAAAGAATIGFLGKAVADKINRPRNETDNEEGEAGSTKAPSAKELSSDEQETFQEIAETLTEDNSADGHKLADQKIDDDASDEKNVAATAANNADADDAPAEETKPDVIPSAFAKKPKVVKSTKKKTKPRVVRVVTPANNAADDANIDGANIDGADRKNADGVADAPRIKTPDHDVDTSILSRLPIPVLVYRDDELLFGNSEFFSLTGYENLYELADAGGVDALFGADADVNADTQALIFHKGGDRLDVHAHLQRVPWDDDRAMLLTLRRGEGGDDTSGPDGTSRVHDTSSIGHNSSATPAPTASDGSAGVTSSIASVTPLRAIRGGAADNDKGNFGGLGTQDLRSILDTATDGVIILSDEGIVKAINRSGEALFNINSDAVIDQNFTKLLAPESHRSALDYVRGMTGSGVASIMNDGREVIGRTKDGGLIPLFMTVGKLQHSDACCAVMRDITQFKKTEEELVTAKSAAESANEQKTEFLAKVSHEIRTPLNAIIGFSDMMIEERFGKIDNERYRGYLQDIHRSGNHVLELINDLLDISKIESGQMELEFDACDLNTIVSETVALTQPDANQERIIIRTSLSAAVPKVVADPRTLRQIILNLVSNSIKYTKSGGQVIVSTVYDDSGEVVMRVRDTGVGMSELELHKALQPFQQVGGTDFSQQGTGLGLPLTKAMVEANRAEFHIESTPDEGTLVEVHFPNQRVLADR